MVRHQQVGRPQHLSISNSILKSEAMRQVYRQIVDNATVDTQTDDSSLHRYKFNVISHPCAQVFLFVSVTIS